MFDDPFVGNTKKFTSNEETIRALQLDLAEELSAIFLYDAHIEATDNEDVKKVLTSIKNEEQVHVGELNQLIDQISNDEDWVLNIDLYNQGVEEVYELLDECITKYEDSKKLTESIDKDEAKEIADIIHQQLGGHKLDVMIGAKYQSYDSTDGSYSFRFSAKAIGGINYCKVEYNYGADDYNMIFGRVSGNNFKILKTIDGLYGEDLERIFGETTGLATRL